MVSHSSSGFPRALCIGAILVLALALRLWNLHFGLPEWYHPDELLKARRIAAIAVGDLHPGSFYHPSFLLYASALTLRLQHPARIGIDEQSAVRAGRLTVALLGTATVGLTVLAGAQIAGTAAGMIAGLLLAVAPLHVVCSHYLKEDVPLTFWALATWIASVGIITRGAPHDITRAAFFAGIAAGTKYTGLLFVALPWLAQRERGIHRAARRIARAAACGFLLTTPFALLDPVGFLRGAGHGGGNAFTGMAGIQVWPWAYLWTYHLRFSILPGVGVLPVLAALVGVIVALRRGDTVHQLLLATVIVLYLVFEGSPYKPPPNAERQVVPLLPFIALLSAAGLQAIAAAAERRLTALYTNARDECSSAIPAQAGIHPEKRKPFKRMDSRRRGNDGRELATTAYGSLCAKPRLTVVLLAIVACGPLWSSVRLTSSMRPDTRQAAADWLQVHACGESRIVLEGALNAGGALVPFYVPALPADCAVSYVYSLERDRAALAKADYAVASSFMYERYLRLLSPSSPVRQFYEHFFATHELVAEFGPGYKSYGFHNPTIRVYALGGTRARLRCGTPATGVHAFVSTRTAD